MLATARSPEAVEAVRAAGAEALHGDVAALVDRRADVAQVDTIFHLALPRLQPPLRRRAARRSAGTAAAGAAAVAAVAAGRRVVMLSSAFAYGERAVPAVDEDQVAAPPAVAAAALAAEAALAPAAPRVVRAPWVHGDTGILLDLVVGLRTRRHRIVGSGDNAWSLLAAGDAADALVAAVGAEPGVLSAAEPETPTQEEVVAAICAFPGLRRPDRVPRALAALSMGGATAEALGMSLRVRTGRLADLGWAPRRSWRETVRRLVEGPRPR